MKRDKSFYKFESLTDFHQVFGLQKPLHPMISFIDIQQLQKLPYDFPKSMVMNFYKISYKTGICGKSKYGQNYYDFGEGGLVFTAPNQLFESPSHHHTNSSLLLIHPDFLLSYPLAKKIKEYGFFSYAANEALHLSDKEKETILSLFNSIDDELNSRIDDFSQDVIIAQVELLLNYCNRFYKRQFITRKSVNNTILIKLDEILDNYFNNVDSSIQGIPSVQLIADQLNVSPSYLSDMLRNLTGQNAQQHIHNKLIEKSKEILSTTNLSISEIAYQLGFEHPQSFSRLFKSKSGLSPLKFRSSFN
ncbi:helix-turn-helix transcriptional regulator [Flavobacterium sp. Fl-77]|uniref:Helix-turn-helix transcriptional regulator n=1 Tax=Flavobacterium flavipigmentatum TaxID=2893884 RepID=A0AAJ2VZN0_9FLAO|nr:MULTISPECIES: helix-turn-helix transcriptional regulator [unclassified Flavobacterium]MDX6183935.1 helix-turn-helix transcriptional regulator [Flavobacterium sp. Fl-33]MDX6187499.1 helix-turn-helix transcriptional regulator [Flavobacterium sp. Fl-77]UFH37663.1 helix-turn-helix transcriptional regulator [Flavobacterium sp. F-70]